MQRRRVGRIAVGGREVDGDGASQLRPAPDVVEKRERFPDFAVDQMNDAGIFVALFRLK